MDGSEGTTHAGAPGRRSRGVDGGRAGTIPRTMTAIRAWSAVSEGHREWGEREDDRWQRQLAGPSGSCCRVGICMGVSQRQRRQGLERAT